MSPDAATPEMPVDCATAREAMEIAAVEPGGLGRLFAPRPSDPVTPSATGPTARSSGPTTGGVSDAAVAAHVISCVDCSAELGRLREIAALLGDALAPALPADLRGRTLAFIADIGRDRSTTPAPAARAVPLAVAAAIPVVEGAATGDPAPTGAPASPPFAALERPASSPRPVPSRRPRTRGVALRVLALAAAFVLAIGGTALVVGSVARSDVAAERERNAALAATAESALRLMADPSAIHIPMHDGAGSAVGMAVIAPATYDATVVAVGLPEPPAGHEYACYIVIDGDRVLVGRMVDGGATYAWAGTIDALAGAAQGSVGGYGVLLVPAGSTSTEGTPVLSGSIQPRPALRGSLA